MKLTPVLAQSIIREAAGKSPARGLDDLAAYVAEQEAEKLKAQAGAAALHQALTKFLEMCEHAADFSNGVVASGIDQGNEWANRFIAQHVTPVLGANPGQKIVDQLARAERVAKAAWARRQIVEQIDGGVIPEAYAEEELAPYEADLEAALVDWAKGEGGVHDVH